MRRVFEEADIDGIAYYSKPAFVVLFLCHFLCKVSVKFSTEGETHTKWVVPD